MRVKDSLLLGEQPGRATKARELFQDDTKVVGTWTAGEMNGVFKEFDEDVLVFEGEYRQNPFHSRTEKMTAEV